MSQHDDDRIGIEYLSMVGAPLPDFIRTAAAAGARNVSLFNTLPASFNPWNISLLSACEDAAVRRETIFDTLCCWRRALKFVQRLK